eukprot:g2624.t1
MGTEVSYAPRHTGDALPRPLYETVLEFESSGRWPDDTAAAQKVAAALLLQIREEMSSDLGIEASATEGFLDLRYPEATFRLRIFHPNEMAEAAQKVTDPQASSHEKDFPEEAMLERLRLLWWRPRVYGALHALVLQHPSLAGATRLFKRWMSSQTLGRGMGEGEASECLVKM